VFESGGKYFDMRDRERAGNRRMEELNNEELRIFAVCDI